MSDEPGTPLTYVIGAVESNVVKIGWSSEPVKRLAAHQRGCPLRLRIIWLAEGGRFLESALHGHFHWRHSHGEWFNFGTDDPVKEIHAAAAALRTDLIVRDIPAESRPAMPRHIRASLGASAAMRRRAQEFRATLGPARLSSFTRRTRVGSSWR